MGGSSPGPPTVSTVTNQTAIPPFLQAADQQVIDQARTATSTPFTSFPTDQAVAPLSPTEQAGVQGVQNEQGVAQPALASAGNTFGGVAGGNTGFTPIGQVNPNISTVTAKAVTPDQIQSYMNPYTSNVVDTTMAQINKEAAQQEASNQRMAGINDAYGGSGSAVLTALNNQSTNQTAASTIAQLESQGYDTALSAAQNQNQQETAAQEANNNFGLQGAQLSLSDQEALAQQQEQALNAKLGAATSLEGVGMNEQTAGLNDANAEISAGDLQRQVAQNQADFNYQQFQQQQQYPFLQSQRFADIVQGVRSPTSTTGTSTTTTPAPNQYSQLAGLTILGSGMLSHMKRGGRTGSSLPPPRRVRKTMKRAS